MVCTLNPDAPREVTLELSPTVYPDATFQARVNTLSQMDEDYWLGSFVVDLNKTGLSLPIQAWERFENTFTLSQIPPKDWDGREMFLQLDCAKTKRACEQRHWTPRFNGLGYGIPAYNPALDVGNN